MSGFNRRYDQSGNCIGLKRNLIFSEEILGNWKAMWC